jgi:hypothetical protein
MSVTVMLLSRVDGLGRIERETRDDFTAYKVLNVICVGV